MFTVLIIDDEAQNCEILGRLFERSGWTAYCLTDSTRALLELGRVRPDVVILDMMMPKVDGMTILRGIRSDIALGDTPDPSMSSTRAMLPVDFAIFEPLERR